MNGDEKLEIFGVPVLFSDDVPFESIFLVRGEDGEPAFKCMRSLLSALQRPDTRFFIEEMVNSAVRECIFGTDWRPEG